MRLSSEPPDGREPAMVHRGRSCDALDARPAFDLAPVVGGVSRTIVELPQSRLLSGNYVVNVHASQANPNRSVSCGELYRYVTPTDPSAHADPTRSTSAALSRRTFAAAAGALAAGGTIATALAQGEGFGKPHEPVVAENDPAIVTARPQITYHGRTIDAYYAAPRDPSRTAAGVVVTQAIWGVDAQLRDTVRRFAKEGYATIAPDLFTGLGAPSGDGATDFAPFRDVAQKLVDATVDADLAAAAGYLRTSTGKPSLRVGVTGFCMGGAIALRQAVDAPAVFGAVAVFYGKVRYGTNGNDGAITPIALAYADDVAVPLAGSWGGRDTSILPDDVRALAARLASLKKRHDVKVYDEAGHAFFDDTRSSYVGSAAADAWTRTLVWFGRYLR